MAEITVHHLNLSRSHRILWLLEELGVEYDLKLYERNKKTMRAPEELRDVHPLGRAPVVTIGDDIVLAESGAIIENLLDHYGNGKLRPKPGSEAHRQYRYWLHYGDGSITTPLFVKLLVRRIRNAPVPVFIKPIARGIAQNVDDAYTDTEVKSHMSFIDAELAKRKWFAGDMFTAADIMMGYPMVSGLDNVEEDYPNIKRFVESIRARDAYKRAIEVGGPDGIPG